MKTIAPEELDRIFDDGEEDILQYFDVSKGHNPHHKIKRANVDFPAWMLTGLDREAKRLGVPRQSIIKIWIGAKLDEIRKEQSVSKVAEPKVGEQKVTA